MNPALPDRDAPGPPERGPPDPSLLVLVVNDNPVNLTVLEAVLAKLGYEVALAENGADAIASCRERPPRAVLMDIDMPVMGGLEATREIRRLQRKGRLPRFQVIALTARNSKADRAAAVAAGMSEFLAKPWSMSDLGNALRRAMEEEPPQT